MELPLFIVFIVIFGSNVQDVVLASDCQDMTSCESCVKQKSWITTCRWCYKDNKCHAYGSLKNPCPMSKDIADVNGCKNVVQLIIQHQQYDANLAYKMVVLSSLAYSEVIANYTLKASEVDTFGSVKQTTKSCSGNAKCSGFVAVSHTEKAIAIVFRGSEHIEQVIKEILSFLTKPTVAFLGTAYGRVQNYFYEAFHLIWSELKTEVYQQIRTYPSYKVWVTGHSLGGALASLASTTLAYEGITTKENLIFYSFGQPRVGDYDYAHTHDILVPISYRVTHNRDVVVHYPACFQINGLCSAVSGWPYHHGKEIYYDHEVMTKSSSYKECNGFPRSEDVACSLKTWPPCFSIQLKNCIKDHQVYFGLRVATWWTHHVSYRSRDNVSNGSRRLAKGTLTALLTSLTLIYVAYINPITPVVSL